VIEALLLTTTPIRTFAGAQPMSSATGFFFQRGGRLFLITSRHVLLDEASDHRPDRVEIELHVDADNLASATGFSILLYRNGLSIWREGTDSAGLVDVAAIELDRSAMPRSAVFRAFSTGHLQSPGDQVEVGTSLLILGFPLGFQDALHHMPVARQAVVASSFGLRFQGQGYFLTDARTHRGSSGAPVVMRAGAADDTSTPGDRELPWILLGVHSARLDVGGRDLAQDEALGLNCAWYADVLLTLTRDEA
jgi:hypothetical protein